MKDPGTEVAKNCLLVCCYALPFRCGSLASWQVPLTSLFESSSNVCGAETRNKQETKKKTVQKKNAAFRTLALLQRERVASIYILKILYLTTI